MSVRCAVAVGAAQGKKNRAQFTNWLCYEETGVCKKKPPALPKVLCSPCGPAAYHLLDLYAPMLRCMAPAAALSCQAPPSACRFVQGRSPGPSFQPMKAGDQNMERMLGEMQVRALVLALGSPAARAALHACAWGGLTMCV